MRILPVTKPLIGVVIAGLLCLVGCRDSYAIGTPVTTRDGRKGWVASSVLIGDGGACYKIRIPTEHGYSQEVMYLGEFTLTP